MSHSSDWQVLAVYAVLVFLVVSVVPSITCAFFAVQVQTQSSLIGMSSFVIDK